MVEIPSVELFDLPDPGLFAILQQPIKIVPGYVRGAGLFAQANTTGDEIDLRVQSPEVRGLVVRYYVNSTLCLDIYRRHTLCHLLGNRLTLEYAPPPVDSNPSLDRQSILKTLYVCKLSIQPEASDWRLEWKRGRASMDQSTRIVWAGSHQEPARVNLEYRSSHHQATLPENLFHLERWLTGHSRLPKIITSTTEHTLTVSTTQTAQDCFAELWQKMCCVHEALASCEANIREIAQAVQITSENCFTARDCASIFPA